MLESLQPGMKDLTYKCGGKVGLPATGHPDGTMAPPYHPDQLRLLAKLGAQHQLQRGWSILMFTKPKGSWSKVRVYVQVSLIHLHSRQRILVGSTVKKRWNRVKNKVGGGRWSPACPADHGGGGAGGGGMDLPLGLSHTTDTGLGHHWINSCTTIKSCTAIFIV